MAGQNPRRYEGTHPWLKFSLDLSRADATLWMLLGEARSKCEHIADVPLDAETATAINKVYFAKGINATTAIEGNTLSEEEVQRRIEGADLDLPKSKQYLDQEVTNMLDAYNGILRECTLGHHPVPSIDWFCALNKQTLANLVLDEGVVPGELRTYSVATGPYVGPQAGDVEHLLRRLCEWLQSDEFSSDDPSYAIPLAIIKAVVAHVYIEWIHPFGDGNGRLGRLVEFAILIGSGVPHGAAHTLTSHYNDTRSQYYHQLHVASRNGGDLRPFLTYAAQGFADGLRGQIQRIREQQETLMWHALVDEHFRTLRPTNATHRQRALAVALGALRGRPVTRPEARVLNVDLAVMYSDLTSKALSRDINALDKAGFVGQAGGNVWARTPEILSGMRPFKAQPAE